jgi:hypothetical protein
MRTQADVLRVEIRFLERELHHATFNNDGSSMETLQNKIFEKQSFLSNIM